LNSGKRREGVFGAIYWWMVKFGFAIAGLLSGAIMTLVGFTPGIAEQPESAITGLRLFYSGFPILGTLISIYIMRNYDLTEHRANEIRAELDRRKKPIKKLSSSYYQADRLLSLSKLNLSTPVTSDIDFSAKNTADIKTLFKDILNQGMHGLCFSPYEDNQDIGDRLSEAQIRRRIEIVAPYTKWVRSFSCTDGNEAIPRLAHEKGMNTLVGAWISGDKDQNEKEIEALIQLARSGYVDIAAVGNEVLLRKELSDQEILLYIQRVKKAVPNIPVGYVDAYYQFYENPELVKVCDVILVNCYPFWEGAHISNATIYLHQMYELALEAAKGRPVIITETGWPNQGTNTNDAQPSDENAMKYFINTHNWTKQNNADLFYFSSFDESWKVRHEGDVGERWGIWDKNEKLKYIDNVV
jgi:GPH family glycoside/pentoside/hexuronide:cation symporter